jgi:hypothetical protein
MWLVATVIRVCPPDGEEIPSIETIPDLVLEALLFLHSCGLLPLLGRALAVLSPSYPPILKGVN